MVEEKLKAFDIFKELLSDYQILMESTFSEISLAEYFCSSYVGSKWSEFRNEKDNKFAERVIYKLMVDNEWNTGLQYYLLEDDNDEIS